MAVKDKDLKKEVPARFLLISGPRTASHLLMRILNITEQPNFLSCKDNGYLFMRAFRTNRELNGLEIPAENLPDSDREQLQAVIQSCFENQESHATAAAAEGKNIYVKEHAMLVLSPAAISRYLFPKETVNPGDWTVTAPSSYGPDSQLNTSDTVLPDAVLKSYRPTFLIRHPALAYPSAYRAQVDLYGKETQQGSLHDGASKIITTMLWTRRLYDWYVNELGDEEALWPVILDADDVMDNRAAMIRYCEMVGMDSSLMKFEWELVTDVPETGRQKVMVKRMMDTLYASKGIRTDKTSKGIDIAVEGRKWRDEFGVMEGELIEKRVRAAMPDYEYLKTKRLT